MGKHTPKYLVSDYDELPETSYWRYGRFITIIVVISIVLIVRQEDPDKIQDARGLLKSIGLQTPIYHTVHTIWRKQTDTEKTVVYQSACFLAGE